MIIGALKDIKGKTNFFLLHVFQTFSLRTKAKRQSTRFSLKVELMVGKRKLKGKFCPIFKLAPSKCLYYILCTLSLRLKITFVKRRRFL